MNAAAGAASMRNDRPDSISIWFFIGVLLVIYGVLITGSAIYQIFVPVASPPVLHELRPGLWWGVILFVLGSVYCVKFKPARFR
jgi:hypothetical protein